MRLKGQKYYYISSDPRGVLFRIEEAYDYHHDVDNARDELGNYYATMGEALTARGRMMRALKDK